jgi:predicted outer membrane repeat protein
MRRRSLFRSFARWFQAKSRHAPGTGAFFGPQDPAPPATAKAEKGACPPARRKTRTPVRRIRLEPLEDRRLLAAILFVNDDATGLNTGVSWADAYTDLQSALAAATSGDEIWVAAGTYKPTSGIDRNISFSLKSGVSLYGGFAATETARGQRDWTTNVTMLSGDIGTAGTPYDNSYHVVAASAIADAALDGFTISAGRANGPDDSWGAGLISQGSSLILANLRISDNAAYNSQYTTSTTSAYGGGAYMSDGTTTLTNVTFSANSADSTYGSSGGGGAVIYRGAATLSGVMFVDNVTKQDGGGLHCGAMQSLSLTDVTFAGNVAENHGGGFYSYYNPSSTILTNVAFTGNSGGDGGGMYNEESSPTLVNVEFRDNIATFSAGGGMCNHYASPTLTGVSFIGNRAHAGGGLLNGYASSTLNDVEFVNNTAEAGGAMFSYESELTLNQVSFIGNSAEERAGAIESQDGSIALTNAIFSGNHAGGDGGAILNNACSSVVRNATFNRNTSAAVAGSVIANTNNSVACVIEGCVIWGNEGIAVADDSTSSTTIAHSLIQGGATEEGNLNSDPLFVDAPNGDLHLQANSPAIDAGTYTGSPSVDLDGNRRPLDGNGDGTAGVDMGAYEFKASNVAPMADAAGPYTVVVGHTVALIGAASQDADGTVTLYEWDFDYDGTTFNVDATGASPTFSAVGLEPGDSRTVALRVTDNNDAVSAIDTATLTACAPRFTAGLFDPSASTFYLRCANITGMADYTFAYGQTDAGWKTLVGDWDGDDTLGVGLYDPNTSTFYLTNAYESGYAQYTFGYGEGGKGWIPLVGDWNGDGRSGVGLYDPQSSTFYLTNSLATRVAEYTFGFGEASAGWTPLVGDWNGGGRTGVGLFNPHASTFYLTSTFQTGFAEHTFGYGEPDAGWQPLVGDWNGDHTDGVGLFASKSSTFYLTDAFTGGYAQRTFGFGQPEAGWIPLVGDWDGRGASGVGLYCPATSTFYLTATLASGYAEYTVGFGQPGANWQPLVGCWTTAGSQGQTYRAQAVDQLDLADLAADALNGVDAEWGV